jgi:hypothetical protein
MEKETKRNTRSLSRQVVVRTSGSNVNKCVSEKKK